MTFLRQKTLPYLLLLVLSAIVFHACIDESISTDSSLKLTFSKDTLYFDTVFTTIGSSTSQFRVYNPNNRNVVITSLGLAGGSSSPFHLNVDGEVNSQNQFTNIELRAKDSLFVFVEVRVDPLNQNNPVFIEDSIRFLTNSNYQSIKLHAYGQDMIILKNDTVKTDRTLTADKPYLIYENLVVDSAQTLTLAPGTKLYFHNKAALIVYGNLIANGKREKNILLRGDRTDQLFEDVPYNYVSNQWGGVLLLNKEGNHIFNFVTMNSGYTGIFIQNNDRNYAPKATITNCKIHNFMKYGLVAQNANVMVANSEISNTGAYAVYLNGGKHTFIHTTIANYFNSSNVRIQDSNREGNAAVTIMELNKIIPMQTVFKNCVIAGSTTPELVILTRFADEFQALFQHSYIRNKKPEKPNANIYQHISWYQPKDTVLFRTNYFNSEELKYYSFVPDSVSPIRDIGNLDVATAYPLDLNGNSRLADKKPDAGAYEWQPTVKR